MRQALILVLALLLLAVFAIAYITYITYFSTKNAGSIIEGSILSAETDSANYLQGSKVSVFGRSTCSQKVLVYANGMEACSSEVSDSDSSYACAFETKAAGEVDVKIESGDCEQTKVIYVNAPQCDEGDARNCTPGNGCPGVSLCVRGEWGGCSATGIVCMPGSKVGCAMPDGCHFGYGECNGCGTGYGECVAGER